MLTGNPLAERRFLLQFPARAQAAGQPDLAGDLLNLLGANSVDPGALAGFLPEWENASSKQPLTRMSINASPLPAGIL